MLSIGQMETLTGLSSRQIRYYEQVGLVEFKRTPGGQRRFEQRDVEILLRIKQLLHEEGDIDGVRRRLKESDGPNVRPLSDQERSKLTSLYPVSDRPGLLRALQEIEVPRPPHEKK